MTKLWRSLPKTPQLRYEMRNICDIFQANTKNASQDPKVDLFDVKALEGKPGQHLSRDQRLIIQFLLNAGPKMSVQEITSRYGLTKQQIYRAGKAENPTPSKRKRGSLLAKEHVDEIESFVRRSFENRSMTYRQLAEGPFRHLEVSYSTIRRALCCRGYKRYISVRQVRISSLFESRSLACTPTISNKY